MSNIIQLRPTVRRTIEVHRVTIDLMPKNVQEKLMEAAIMVGFLLGNGEYELSADASQEAIEIFDNLEKAVNLASQYTVPGEMEVDEPV